MSGLKTYVTDRVDTHLPREWMDELGAPDHVSQAELLIIAPMKKDMEAMLTDLGMDPGYAHAAVRSAENFTDQLPTDWQLVVDAPGLIDITVPGVYAVIRGGVVNQLVVHVVAAGTVLPIARFAIDSTTRRMYATTP